MLYAKALAVFAGACAPRDVIVIDFKSGGELKHPLGIPIGLEAPWI